MMPHLFMSKNPQEVAGNMPCNWCKMQKDGRSKLLGGTWCRGVYWAEHLESTFLDGFWQVSPGNIDVHCSRSRGFGWYLFKDHLLLPLCYHPIYVVLWFVVPLLFTHLTSYYHILPPNCIYGYWQQPPFLLRKSTRGQRRHAECGLERVGDLVATGRDIVRPDSEMRGFGFLPPKMVNLSQYGDV